MSLISLIIGETLQDERVNGGALIGIDGSQFPHKLIPVSLFTSIKFVNGTIWFCNHL